MNCDAKSRWNRCWLRRLCDPVGPRWRCPTVRTVSLQRILSSGIRIIIAAMLADPVNKDCLPPSSWYWHTMRTPTVNARAARAMGMVGPDWVWIGSQIWVESPMDPVVPDGVIGCLGYTNVSNPIYKRFYNKWQGLYTSQPNTTWKNAMPIPVSPFVYDNVLFGFRALNELHQSLTSANVLASLRSTTMLGATSEIELDANGERVAAYNLMNYVTRADGTKAWVQVGNVWPTGVELTSTVHWTSGRTSTPVDVPTVRRVPRQVSVAASTTVIVLASFGILVTAIVLAFNVHYRDLTFIKMSSPIFNNVILVGVIVGFVYIIVLGVSNGTNCLVRVALLSFAFSMCFGGLFIKTYRVAAIFNTGAEAKVVKIKNRLLFAYMGALIAIDVVIICVWAIVDPITTLVTDLPSIPDDLDPDNSIVQPYISRCNSVHYDTFLGTIYGVKGIIIIWGAFLSARTSHVTIPALNDSKQIGLAIYTTGLISLSIVPGLEFLSPEQVTVQFIMASMAVIVGLFANIAILFVPKIQAVISGRHAKLTKTQAITNDFATRKPTTTPTPHT